jgi:hypothetical protein
MRTIVPSPDPSGPGPAARNVTRTVPARPSSGGDRLGYTFPTGVPGDLGRHLVFIRHMAEMAVLRGLYRIHSTGAR